MVGGYGNIVGGVLIFVALLIVDLVALLVALAALLLEAVGTAPTEAVYVALTVSM